MAGLYGSRLGTSMQTLRILTNVALATNTSSQFVIDCFHAGSHEIPWLFKSRVGSTASKTQTGPGKIYLLPEAVIGRNYPVPQGARAKKSRWQTNSTTAIRVASNLYRRL